MTRILALFMLLSINIKGNSQNAAKTEGEIRGPIVWKSKIYPGTERHYWVYVPKQYDPSKPACTMVVTDGLSRATGWKLPAVLDSLIALKEIPVTIGIFIDHGRVLPATTDNFPRFNRSVEYDALGDRYARFLLEEIIPEVSRSFNLSTDPNDRSIAGASSGAICAFNVAWERPDAFRRVLSTIGTYVGIRGGDEFATLVRKTEPKPLRVFLEDGNHDLNIAAGDWWMANQDMLSALTWSGYEVNHEWGEGGHDSKHAITILANALKWLWKDYPAPVQTHRTETPRLNPTIEGEPWKEIQMKDIKINRLAVNKAGEIYFSSKNSIFRTDYDVNVLFAKLKGTCGGISFHEDGKLYAADLGQRKIMAINEKGEAQDLTADVYADFLTTTSKGIYFTETSKDRVGFYSFINKSVTYVNVPLGPSGLTVSAEQTFLNVSLANHVFGYSLRIKEDGGLDAGQDYMHFHIAYGATVASARGMTTDAENLVYSATGLGVQVTDQLGRVNFIFGSPMNNAIDVKFGGPGFGTLYLNCNGKLYSRKTSSKGVLSWLPPVKPTRPGM